MNEKLLSEAAAIFQRDGVVLLPGVFRENLPALRAGVERNIREPGRYTRGYTPEGRPGRFFGDYCNWQRIPEFEDFIRNSPAAAIAGRLMGSASVRIFHEHVLVKEPGTEQPTPWHHDQPYYSVHGDLNISFWIPLDAVSRDTCPEFIAGSQAWGRWFLPRRFNGIDYDFPEENYEPIPDFEAERERYTIRGWDLQPGDAIAFHFRTVHSAPANLSGRRRRGFAVRWLGDDARWAARSGEVSPPFPELHEVLRDGDELNVAQFPVVWRVPAGDQAEQAPRK